MTDHTLHADEIAEVRERASDAALVRIWCSLHQRYEWHWLEIDDLSTENLADLDAAQARQESRASIDRRGRK